MTEYGAATTAGRLEDLLQVVGDPPAVPAWVVAYSIADLLELRIFEAADIQGPERRR
jgi:hypothetical protein